MAQVTVSINNKSYSMECDEGQQHRVLELGKYVDSKLKQIAAAGAAQSDSHLLVLTSILLTDEIFELRDNLTALSDHVEGKVNADEQDRMAVEAIDHLAERINVIAGRLKEAA